MSATAPTLTPRPTHRLRGVLYATVLLVGGGVIGAVVAGPTLGQGNGQGQGQGSGQAYDPDGGRDRGSGPDGPRWHHRFMDRQQGEDEGPGWRHRFGGRRFGMQQNDDRHGMRGRSGFARMMYPGAIERRVNRVLGLVDASTEQKQKVRAIFEKAASDLYGNRDKRMENRRAMREALGAATVDHSKVEQLRQERMKLADTTSKRMTDAFVEAAEVLTPAQRADLAARMQRRRGG